MVKSLCYLHCLVGKAHCYKSEALLIHAVDINYCRVLLFNLIVVRIVGSDSCFLALECLPSSCGAWAF